MVMRTWSLAAPQGPAGSFEVRVSVTPPAATAPGVGWEVAFRAEAPGPSVPPPPLHVPVVARPPTVPARCTCGLDAHSVWSGPASAVAAGVSTMVIWSLAGAQG